MISPLIAALEVKGIVEILIFLFLKYSLIFLTVPEASLPKVKFSPDTIPTSSI